MAIPRCRHHAPAERRKLALNPFPMRLKHLIDEGLVTLRIAMAGHLPLELHRAHDIGKQNGLQIGHTYQSSDVYSNRQSRRPLSPPPLAAPRSEARPGPTKKPALPNRQDGLASLDLIHRFNLGV